MTDALADVADKQEDTTQTDKTAENAAAAAKDKATEADKGSDAGKVADDKAKADRAAKEFVADPAKTDEENAAALKEWEKANEGEKEPQKGGLPDDWREQASKGDEETLKLLKRYGSIAGVAKALVEARKMIGSGKPPVEMPDPKDEKAMVEWRKSQGIPEDPTGYEIPEPIQKRLVDEDKPLLSSFTEFAHKKNLTPAAVAATTEWYVEMSEAAAAKQMEEDKAAGESCEDTLRKDWAHSEYKGNITLAHRWVESVPGLGTDFAVARTPDGRRLVDNPEFIAWAADQARNKFGDLAFSTSDAERKHTARKEEIEQIMKTDINAYREQGLAKEYEAILEKELARGKR